MDSSDKPICCLRCKKPNATIHNLSPGQHYCKSCFITIIEKRIRKEIRGKLIHVGKTLFIGECTYAAAKRFVDLQQGYLVKEEGDFGEGSLEALFRSNKFKNFLLEAGIRNVIVPWTQDHEASEFLGGFFENREWLKTGSAIKLFREINCKEADLYISLLECPNKKIQVPAQSGFIDALEQKYPEIKSSLVRSKETLGRILDEADGHEKTD